MPDELTESTIGEHCHYLEAPPGYLKRIITAIPKIIHILVVNPSALMRALNIKKYGSVALSLKLIFWIEPFLRINFDLVHCHFGPIANKFAIIKEILNLKQNFVTTFYGYDVSKVIKEKGLSVYDKLKNDCSLFFVMSNNMKERIHAQGFDSKRIEVLPISIEVEKYPFKERDLEAGEKIKMITVGRFVEKKGFDDLLRALAIVKERSAKKFKCSIVGDGPLKNEIHKLTNELKLKDVVDFRGYMKLDDVINLFLEEHFFVQPSKTAKDGDME